MKKTSSNNKPLFRNCPMSRHFETRFCNNCKYCEKYDECLIKKEHRKEKRRKLKIKRRILALEWVATFSIVLAIVIKVFLPQSNINTKEAETVVETTAQEESTPAEIIYINIVDINENEDEDQSKALQPSDTTSDDVINLLQVETTDTTEDATPTISAYSPNNTYYYHISDEDKLYIKKAVYAEARGECYEGKVAVAAVILNRYFSNNTEFNRNSIYSVITQSKQFASIDNINEEMLASYPDIEQAVEDALCGWDPTRKVFENGALYFYAPEGEMSEYQRNLREGIEVLTIERHNFHVEFNEDVVKFAGKA